MLMVTEKVSEWWGGHIFWGIDFDVLVISDTKWYALGRKKKQKQGTQVEAKLVYMDLLAPVGWWRSVVR